MVTGNDKGYQLLELLVVLVVLALLASLGLPALSRATSGLRVRLAAQEVVGALRHARAYAVRHNMNVAVKFRLHDDGRVTYALYRDGDGDGVLNRDIEAGMDPQVVPERRLEHFGRHVRFGFPPGPAPRDPGDPRRRLARLHDPIRFNRSDLASFSPLGTSTPGSVYLTDGREHLVAVRLFGRTGKAKILTYSFSEERWR